MPDVLYVPEPARRSELNHNLINSDPPASEGLLCVSQMSFTRRCEVRMTDEAELDPAERDELDRLCDEYTVATNCVVKALRVVNPLERVNLFLAEEQKVADLTGRIKAILKAEHS